MDEFHFKRKSLSISKSPARNSAHCGSATGSGEGQLESACEASDDPGDGNNESQRCAPLNMNADTHTPTSAQFEVNAATPLPPSDPPIWPQVLEECFATRCDLANARSKSMNILSTKALELDVFDSKFRLSDNGDQSMSVKREMGTTSSNSGSSSSSSDSTRACNANFIRCSDKSFRKDDAFAWLVCASAFLGGCVVWGTSGVFPLLLNPMIATFNQSARDHNQKEDPTIAFKLSFIQSVQFFLTMTGSLFAGPLCEKIGIRCITVLGVLLAFAGPILPYFFIDSIALWVIGIGLLNGLGNSMIEVARPVVVRQHFSKYYGLASGIVGSGSAVAYTIFPLAIDFGFEHAKPPMNETADPLKLELQKHQASRLPLILLAVSGCYATLFVCALLWSDHSLAAGASNSAHSSQSTAITSSNANAVVTMSRSLAVPEVIATSAMLSECDICTHQPNCICTRCRPARFALLPQDDLLLDSKRDMSDPAKLKHSWSDQIVFSECPASPNEVVELRMAPLPPTPPSLASVTSKFSASKWFCARAARVFSRSDGEKNFLGFKWYLLSNYNFMVIAMAHAISYMASSIPDMHMYKYVDDMYSESVVLNLFGWTTSFGISALTLTVYGLTTFSFSIVSGKLSDMYPRIYFQMFIMAIGQWVTGIAFTLCPLLFNKSFPIRSLWVPIIMNAIWGLGDAGQAALYSVSIANTVKTRDLAQVCFAYSFSEEN